MLVCNSFSKEVCNWPVVRAILYIERNEFLANDVQLFQDQKHISVKLVQTQVGDRPFVGPHVHTLLDKQPKQEEGAQYS